MLSPESPHPVTIATPNVFGIAILGIIFCHCLNSSMPFINSLFQKVFIDYVQVLCKCWEQNVEQEKAWSFPWQAYCPRVKFTKN